MLIKVSAVTQSQPNSVTANRETGDNSIAKAVAFNAAISVDKNKIKYQK